MRPHFLVVSVLLAGCAGLLGSSSDDDDDDRPEAGTSSGEEGPRDAGRRADGAASSSSSGEFREAGASSSSSSGGADGEAEETITLVEVAAGRQDSCAITQRAELACWSGSQRPVYVRHANDLPLQSVRAVGIGNGSICAMTESPNRVWCWGNNGYGRLGIGNMSTGNDRPTPVVDQAGSVLDDWDVTLGKAALAVGDEHVCALRQGGRVACWGRSDSGKLGAGVTANQPFAGLVADASGSTPLSGLRGVGVGTDYSCAITAQGGVLCWGSNFRGTLGDGSTAASSAAPVAVRTATAVLSGVEQLSVGGRHACVKRGGRASCWGDNGDLELGAGITQTSSNTALPVRESSGGELMGVVGVSAGGRHTCASTASAGILCWGNNASGQLGVGVAGGKLSAPSTVVRALDTPAETLRKVAAGYYHSVAIDEDGMGWGWGDRALGLPNATYPSAVKMELGELVGAPR